MSKISDILPEDESLEKESPLLHSISKENPFSVPENYFEYLPSEIIEKCTEKAVSRKSSVIHKALTSYLLLLTLYKWRLLTITGCVVAICILTMRINNRPMSYEAMVKNIPDSLIVGDLDNNISDISISSLEDAQESEGTSNSVRSVSDSASADQDIIAYLMNNNVSVSDIVNEQ